MSGLEDDAYYAEEWERDHERMQRVSTLDRLIRETDDPKLQRHYSDEREHLMRIIES